MLVHCQLWSFSSNNGQSPSSTIGDARIADRIQNGSVLLCCMMTLKNGGGGGGGAILFPN